MNVKSSNWRHYGEQAYATLCLENYTNKIKEQSQPKKFIKPKSCSVLQKSNSFHTSSYYNSDRNVNTQLIFEATEQKSQSMVKQQIQNPPLFESGVQQLQVLQKMLKSAEDQLQGQKQKNHNLQIQKTQIEQKLERVLRSKQVDELLIELDNIKKLLQFQQQENQQNNTKYIQYKEMYMQEFGLRCHIEQQNIQIIKENNKYKEEINQLTLLNSQFKEDVEKYVEKLSELKQNLNVKDSGQLVIKQIKIELITENEIKDDIGNQEDFKQYIISKYSIQPNEFQIIINQVQLFLKSKPLFVKLGIPIIQTMLDTRQLLDVIDEKWNKQKILQAVEYKSWPIENNDVMKILIYMIKNNKQIFEIQSELFQ
ncbi:hypothetical protein SS50377_23115 [Spironucleus salmonicida]|uniref:Uncharacterized protein n=1 Tax=Spironucleus salmonicida TaxID=348837 RepID=V6LB94_9EUKA|nr:hypothetical protein SS50377_23115 [Spironucleus salmonicida]|eukprot:EST41710.1 Hypothetical protein SS50377_fx003 [Spironucleus salmonicida]